MNLLPPHHRRSVRARQLAYAGTHPGTTAPVAGGLGEDRGRCSDAALTTAPTWKSSAARRQGSRGHVPRAPADPICLRSHTFLFKDAFDCMHAVSTSEPPLHSIMTSIHIPSSIFPPARPPLFLKTTSGHLIQSHNPFGRRFVLILFALKKQAFSITRHALVSLQASAHASVDPSLLKVQPYLF